MGVKLWGWGFDGYLYPLVPKHQVHYLLDVAWFRVQGSGFRVQGSGCRVWWQGLGARGEGHGVRCGGRVRGYG